MIPKIDLIDPFHRIVFFSYQVKAHVMSYFAELNAPISLNHDFWSELHS